MLWIQKKCSLPASFALLVLGLRNTASSTLGSWLFVASTCPFICSLIMLFLSFFQSNFTSSIFSFLLHTTFFPFYISSFFLYFPFFIFSSILGFSSYFLYFSLSLFFLLSFILLPYLFPFFPFIWKPLFTLVQQLHQ